MSEFAHYRKSKGMVLMLSGKTCGPCKGIEPYVDQLAADNPSIQFVKAMNDELPQLFAGCEGLPTFVFFIHGNREHQFTGANQSMLYKCVKLTVQKAAEPSKRTVA